MNPDPEQRRAHWQGVYRDKDPERVSWYQPRLQTSLELIANVRLQPPARVLDVGAGACTLPVHLAERGYRVWAVDLSDRALATGRSRAGSDEHVLRLAADATWLPLAAGTIDLWHDRAAFHFLVDPADRDRYLQEMDRVLGRNGQVILATFGPEGPERCSGLPAHRYRAATLQQLLGPGFELCEEHLEQHRTPSDRVQQFLYVRFCRSATA